MYDANGNLTGINLGQSDWRSMKYDYRNRMVEHSGLNSWGGREVWTYRYDVFGRRIQRGRGITLWEIWDFYDGNQQIESYSGNHIITPPKQSPTSTIFGQYLDEPIVTITTSGLRYYHHDDMFNVVATTDGSGQQTASVEYDDFGLPTGQAQFMFQGRQYDPETGFYWYRTRYYDPRAGRFSAATPSASGATRSTSVTGTPSSGITRGRSSTPLGSTGLATRSIDTPETS